MKDFTASTQDYYSEINFNLESIACKLKAIQKYGLKIFFKSECIQSLFNERLVKALVKKRVAKSEEQEFVEKFHSIIVPFSC